MFDDDIIIIRRGKDIFGNTVLLYHKKNESDLLRIKLKDDIKSGE